MDPDLLRNIEYFLEPDRQNDDHDAQQQRRINPGGSATAAPNFWDIAGPSADSGLGSPSPSTAATSLSFDPFAQASKSSERQQPHLYGQQSRVILPPRRPSKPKPGHERKRTKLSTESTPFDNVDYWIQFDHEEGTGEGQSSDLNHQKGEVPGQQRSKTKPPSQPRPHNHNHRSISAPGPSAPRPQQHRPKPEDSMWDDSALDYALSEEGGESFGRESMGGDQRAEDFSSMNLADQMSNIDTMPPSEVPPREGLYSTPLSWEKPQPGLRLDSLISMQSPTSLNEAEQRRLIAIAMNTGPMMGGLGSGSGLFQGSSGYSAGGNGLHATLGPGMNVNLGGYMGMGQITDDAPLLRPETPDVAKPPQPRLSRATTEMTDRSEKGKGKAGPGDRTAHNDIERKYRTNLKDKIAELRDAVPALRTIQEGVVDDGDSSSAAGRPKVSKGVVLTKATEYISYLEKKNKAIMQQHQQLSRRLAAFEQLLSQTARPSFQMPNYSRTLFDPRAFC